MKLLPYLLTQITESRYWGPRFPPAGYCLCTARWSLEREFKMQSLGIKAGLCTVQHKAFKRVPWKAIKTIQKGSQPGEQTGRGQVGQTLRRYAESGVLIQGCLWLQPWKSTRARCSASRLSSQEYWAQEQVCANRFVRDTYFFIYSHLSIHLTFSPIVLQQYIWSTFIQLNVIVTCLGSLLISGYCINTAQITWPFSVLDLYRFSWILVII